MGCSASKTSKVVVPMPTEVKENLKSSSGDKPQEVKIETEQTTTAKTIQVKQSNGDSLHGSRSSLNSNSDSGRSDRESSAKSTRTMDSGLGELEDDQNIVTERSTLDKQKVALLEQRPPTPGLFTFRCYEVNIYFVFKITSFSRSVPRRSVLEVACIQNKNCERLPSLFQGGQAKQICVTYGINMHLIKARSLVFIYFDNTGVSGEISTYENVLVFSLKQGCLPSFYIEVDKTNWLNV